LKSAATFLPWTALGVVVTFAYGSVLLELVRDWLHDPNYSHGLLIPGVSAFLIWKDRRHLGSLPRSPSNLGVLGILLAACMLILGAAAAEVFTQRVSLIVLLAAIVLFVLGWRSLERLAFPLALLLLAIPLPYLLYYSLTGPLQAYAARCAVFGLDLVGVPAFAQGNVIHLSGASLEVAEACSGVRSLYALLALGALLAHSMTIPVWGRTLVFLMTIPLSIVTNAFRVWASGLGAHFIGPRATEGTVHELFGLIVFATALGLFLLVRRGARNLWPSVPGSSS
jgi:exosortase